MRISWKLFTDIYAYIWSSLQLKGFTIRSGNKSLPFVFKDIMGLEAEVMAGSQPDDIISAVFGHVKDGYKVINHINI